MSAAAAATRSSRFAALGILVALIVVAYAGLVHWWWTARMIDLHRRSERLLESERHMRELSGHRTAVDAKLAELRSATGSRGYLLASGSVSSASAGLLRIVEEAATKGESCVLTQRDALPAKRDGAVTRISLKAGMKCDMDGLVRMIDALERGSSSAYLEEVSVESVGRGALPKQSLSVTLELTGFVAAPADAPSQAGRQP